MNSTMASFTTVDMGVIASSPVVAVEEEPSTQHYPNKSALASKWLGFISAVWVQAISGNNYTFANYSVELKTILRLNQVSLNGLSTAKDVGKAFGIVAGFLYDYLPPWAILLIGSVEGLLGYGVQWLVVGGKIKPLPYWMMCVVLCMGGNSTTWMNTAVLVTCLRNFKQNRGPVSGILKAYVGLSTAIFTDLCMAIFAGDAAAFVLMLAIIPLGVCAVAMFLLKPQECDVNAGVEVEESRCFRALNFLAIMLAFYLLAYDLSGIKQTFLSRLVAGGLCLILVAPVVLPIYLHARFAWRKRRMVSTLSEHARSELGAVKASVQKDGSKPAAAPDATVQEDVEALKTSRGVMGQVGSEAFTSDDEARNQHGDVTKVCATANETRLLGGTKEASLTEGGVKVRENYVGDISRTAEEKLLKGDVQSRKKLGEDFSALEALKTVDFWLLFFCFLCGVGTGMAVINNLGQIGESLGYSNVSVFVSLISISGFFGRLGSGELSEYLIRWKAVPRPVLLAASQLVMVLGYLFLATGAARSLYIGSIVVGMCYGVRLSVSVPVASEMFGLKSLGMMYNVLILNLPLGSLLLSSLLAGFLYDHEAAKGGVSNTCLGAHCYRLVFMLMAAVSAMGSVLDVILAHRTRSVYRQICQSKRLKF